MKTKDELQRARQNLAGRLEGILAGAHDDGERELTVTEAERCQQIKTDIGKLEEELAGINRQETDDLVQSLYGEQKHDVGGKPDHSLERQIHDLARELAGVVESGQAIKRAITIPVGYSHGHGVSGDPTDVTDLGALFRTIPIDSPQPQAVRLDATDGVVVAEGVAKPDIVTATLVSADAVKIAGMATMTTETAMYVAGAERALMEVIRGAIISGANAKIIADLEAGGTDFATAGDTLPTFLGAVGTVLEKSSSVVAITNVATWVDLTLALASLPQNVQIPTIHIADTTGSNGIIAASSAVEVHRSPVMVLVDPYTLAHENKLRVVAEQFVAVNIVRPTLVQIADLAGPVTLP